MSIDFDFEASTLTQKIAFIGACIMMINAILGIFGIGSLWATTALHIIFGIIGLFYNPILLFIAFFVWMGAAQETRMVRVKSVLDRIP